MLGVLVVNAREGAKGKKDIIDSMHEHKVYQQILEQQHLNIIILLSFGNDSGI